MKLPSVSVVVDTGGTAGSQRALVVWVNGAQVPNGVYTQVFAPNSVGYYLYSVILNVVSTSDSYMLVYTQNSSSDVSVVPPTQIGIGKF